MPDYNFLKGNESDFPHVGNVDVFKYDNGFDYGRFDATQMELLVCTVPWDMGEAHIGNRTISGIGNVVYFETKEKRDAWFDALPDSECYRFETKFKELHRDHVIDVPIPYDMCAKHNYLVVRYALFANDTSPVQYEGNGGLREWFWFIREVEFVAPNTTRLHLLEDAWQTWIYDVDVVGMVLERGHAPMFAMKAGEYLQNPIANNKGLLTEDVNFGDATQVSHIDAVALNAGKMYACVATTANPTGSWGTKGAGTWNVPSSSYYMNQGAPSVYVFATAAVNLNTLLTNIDSSMPQFKQTIQAVFFASDTLLTLAGNFTFANVTCYGVHATRKTIDLAELDKSDFGYGSRYEDIAKLYTSPYAHLEITDEDGKTDMVRIEDTDGKLKVSALLSLAYPFVNIEAHLQGVGGNASKTVTFKNISEHSITLSGKWYETLRSWQVPTFAVVLDPATEYDYSTHFDRAQRVVDYTTEYSNTTDASATAQANVNADAANMVANAALTTATNTAVTNRANTSANTDALNTVTVNDAQNTAVNLAIDLGTASTVAANEMQGSISASSTMASGAVGAIGSAISLDVGGAVSALANAAIGAQTTYAQTQVGIGLTQANASIAKASNNATTILADDGTNYKVSNQTATASDITSTQNDLVTGSTANSAGTLNANAARSKATSDAIAARTQTQAQSAIANDVSQAALRTPFVYGSFSDGDNAVTKPMALFAHVVTQSKAAIASAGDEFLRYGYHLGQQWDFDGNWNIGKHYTYWKLHDFWVKNLDVPDMYMDRLRFFLFGGVTVWRKPEDIGHVSVYDNFG